MVVVKMVVVFLCVKLPLTRLIATVGCLSACLCVCSGGMPFAGSPSPRQAGSLLAAERLRCRLYIPLRRRVPAERPATNQVRAGRQWRRLLDTDRTALFL